MKYSQLHLQCSIEFHVLSRNVMQRLAGTIFGKLYIDNAGVKLVKTAAITKLIDLP